MMSLFNKIIKKCLRLLGLNNSNKPIKTNSIFVVSTGRTGTLFFETFFNEILPESYSVHEPTPDLFYISMEKLRNGASREQVVQYIIKNRRQLLAEKGALQKINTYIECNPFMPLILDEVKQAFPNSKFIIITRDAKSYVKSALNKSPNGDESMFMYGDNDHRDRMSALDFENDEYHNKWNNFNRIQKISWYWNKCNLILLDFLNSNKEHSLYIAFENLFTTNNQLRKAEIKKIASFVNVDLDEERLNKILPIFENKRNSTSTVFYEGYDEWSDDEQLHFVNLTTAASSKINELKRK